MDFTPSPAQLALATLTRQILQDRSGPDQLRRLDQQRGRDQQRGAGDGDRFDPRLWEVLAETGVLSAAVPEAAGGDGESSDGLLEQCSVLVEVGRALAPVPYRATVALAGSALARFGTPQQQADWLKPALAGRSVLTVALTEPGGGNPLAPSTRAEPTATGWRLSGTRTTVPAGPLAQLVLVPATAPDGPGLFAVTPQDGGVRMDRQRMIDQDDAGRLELDDVELPADRRIGSRYNGRVDDEPLAWLLRRATVTLAAHQLGVLERALELTAEYATTRTQFDRPIGSFQAVAQRLADAYIQVQALRLTLWKAAWSLQGPDSSVKEVATAGFWLAEAGHYVAHTCIHVHGGTGIDVEQPIHRYFLAAKRAEFELGGATAALLTLGTALAGPVSSP
jgi:alkylation response protein AidB-like acyl-CoA dehydrogenase